jgi:hypothetical protein
VRENRKDRDNKPRKECFFFFWGEREILRNQTSLYFSLSHSKLSQENRKKLETLDTRKKDTKDPLLKIQSFSIGFVSKY